MEKIQGNTPDKLKHAFLIMAHTEFLVLEKLVNCLDDVRNDIYIHFDKKVSKLPDIVTHWAELFIVDDRIDVRWGDVSVVAAEYRLFETAAAQQHYLYYHLLSGVDLPLKSQDEIHAFFYKNRGCEFIGFQKGNNEEEIDRKVRRIHLYSKRFRAETGVAAGWCRTIRAISLRFQLIFGLYQNRELIFKKGTQWVSVTDAFVRYILPKKEGVLKIYRKTFCSDEIFIQTLCWNSFFRFRLFSNSNEEQGCQRLIGWKNGELLEWTNNDFYRLILSNMLFARKFSSRNSDLIDRVVNHVKNKENP